MLNRRATGLALVLLTHLLLALLAAPVAAQTVTICAPPFVLDALADLEDEHENLRLAGVDEDLDPGDCDGLIAGYRGIENFLVADSPLRWIQSNSAGVEGFLEIPDLRDSDIVLTNAEDHPGARDRRSRLRPAPQLHPQHQGLQRPDARGLEHERELPMIELSGKTALVIGLGGIGTQIAQRAAAFGMTVIAVDPKDVPIHRDVTYVGKPDELDDLLPRADVVFSSVPHTPASEGMIGARQFELMKQDVYFINISRGKIVDTDALVAALRSGKVPRRRPRRHRSRAAAVRPPAVGHVERDDHAPPGNDPPTGSKSGGRSCCATTSPASRPAGRCATWSTSRRVTKVACAVEGNSTLRGLLPRKLLAPPVVAKAPLGTVLALLLCSAAAAQQTADLTARLLDPFAFRHIGPIGNRVSAVAGVPETKARPTPAPPPAGFGEPTTAAPHGRRSSTARKPLRSARSRSPPPTRT